MGRRKKSGAEKNVAEKSGAEIAEERRKKLESCLQELSEAFQRKIPHKDLIERIESNFPNETFSRNVKLFGNNYHQRAQDSIMHYIVRLYFEMSLPDGFEICRKPEELPLSDKGIENKNKERIQFNDGILYLLKTNGNPDYVAHQAILNRGLLLLSRQSMRPPKTMNSRIRKEKHRKLPDILTDSFTEQPIRVITTMRDVSERYVTVYNHDPSHLLAVLKIPVERENFIVFFRKYYNGLVEKYNETPAKTMEREQ